MYEGGGEAGSEGIQLAMMVAQQSVMALLLRLCGSGAGKFRGDRALAVTYESERKSREAQPGLELCFGLGKTHALAGFNST